MSTPAAAVEDEGVEAAYDGSSIRGLQAIGQSDATLSPDM